MRNMHSTHKQSGNFANTEAGLENAMEVRFATTVGSLLDGYRT